MLVLPQRAQIKSIKQMKFLPRQTQNRWKFVIANVRVGWLVGCKLWRYIWRGLNTCDEMWQGGVGGRFLPKIVWRHLWTAPIVLLNDTWRFSAAGAEPLVKLGLFSWLRTGPALVGRRGPVQRPWRGAPLSSNFIMSSCSVNRVTIVVERRYTAKR